jgi:hypothetical protein
VIGGAAREIGLAGLVALAAACASDGYVLEYEGAPGRPTTATFVDWVPGVDLALGAVAARRFLVDTGAPLTMMDSDSYPDFPQGSNLVDVDALGLRFPSLPVVAVDVFSYEEPSTAAFHGIVGGDVLQAFALSLDYRQPRVWLSDSLDGELPDEVDPAEVAGVIRTRSEVRGGGRAVVPGECPGGCGVIELPATRFLVDIAIESRSQPVRALVDSGASVSVLRERLLADLPAVGRPRLEGVTVGTAGGIVVAYITRVWSLRLEGAEEPVEQVSAPILVLPDDETLFDSLSGEVGDEVDGIIGASFLREFLVTLDYPDQSLDLARYRSRDHVDESEYVGVGFTLESNGSGGWVIGRVIAATDAEAEGLVAGEAVAELGGRAVPGLSRAELTEILAEYELGEEVPVAVQRGAEIARADVAVEDLLPAFEGP